MAHFTTLVNPSRIMLTPKQLALISSLAGESLNYNLYLEAALNGKSWTLTATKYPGRLLRISANGKLEARTPLEDEGKPFERRLAIRALCRCLTQIALAGIPIGAATKELLRELARAQDFRSEIESASNQQQKMTKNRGAPSE